jgi:hypothetical protein
MKRLKVFHCFSFFKERFTRKKFKVVYDSDVPKLLSSLGLLEKIERGEITCKNCNNKITIENFNHLRFTDGKFDLFCNKNDCICYQ